MSGHSLPSIYDSLVLDAEGGIFEEMEGNQLFAKGDRLSVRREVGMDQWWYDYCVQVSDTIGGGDSSSSDDGPSGGFTLGEVVREHAPFAVDLRFDIVDSPYNRTADFWAELSSAFAAAAQRALQARYETTEQMLSCLVLDSGDIWETEDGCAYKMRLVFPFVDVALEEQEELRRTVVGLLEGDRALQEKVSSRLRSGWASIVGGPSAGGDLQPLYGATVGGEPPLLMYAFFGRVTQTVEQLDLSLLHPANAARLGKLARFQRDIREETTGTLFEAHDALFSLPVILSARYDLLRPELRGEKSAPEEGAENAPGGLPRPTSSTSRLERIRWFLSLIAPETWRKRSYWRSILLAVKHEFRASRKGLQLVKDYCKHHGAFSAAECENWYARPHPDVMETENSLEWFAAQDQPQEVSEWRAGLFAEKLESFFDPANQNKIEEDHALTAELFITLFPYESAVNLRTGQSWFFHPENHRWTEQDNFNTTYRRIIDQKTGFRAVLREYKNKYNERMLQESRNGSRELELRYMKFAGDCQKLYNKLGNSGYLRSVVEMVKREIKEVYPNFLDLCNRNIEIYGCGNGVLHSILADGSVTIRNGKPEDYITVGSDTEYRADFSMSSPEVQKYLEYMRKVFPDDGTRHVVHKLDAKQLMGRNHDKKFVWQLGPPGSGKSTKAAIDSRMHGAYYKNVSDDYFLSHGPGADKPSSQLAEAANARQIGVDETNGVATYSSARIKRYTGGIDAVFARKMREDGCFRVPMGIPYFTGNEMPIFDSPGPAMVERALFVPYVSVFYQEGDKRLPETEEERWRKLRFPRSLEIEENIATFAEAALWHRVHYFPTYAKERFTELPKQMTERLQKYWKENDPYAHYLKKVVEEDELGFVNADDLFLDYTRWFTTYYNQLQPPIWSTFKRSVEEHLGPLEDGRWHGYTMRDQDRGAAQDPEFVRGR